MLQNCLPTRVRQKLIELPKTLDETYERVLNEIGKADGTLARRILQCLTVAIRPLRVEELAEILALDFEEAEGRIPKFNENWRLQDRQQALMITCSSLIAIVDDHGSRVVQFSHFSVKEFLTSDRLATPVRDISVFHILPEPAHAVLAQACLAVLLLLDDSIPKDLVQSRFPLARYAARHWVDHAQFENASLRVKDGMQQLFDQSKPHFAAWLKLYDVDLGYPITTQPHATPLYYASLCGFRGLAEHLVNKSPQDANAEGGQRHNPLTAALCNQHFHVAELLRQHGAAVELMSYNNRTLLVEGHTDAVRWLLEHGANVTPRPNNDRTSTREVVGVPRRPSGLLYAMIDHGGSPLHLASACDHFKIMQLLIQRGADVSARDSENSTPLHLASRWGVAGSMQLLIRHGADVNARDEDGSTPLHHASSAGIAESMQLLIRYGADVSAPNKRNVTPLHQVIRVSVKTVWLSNQHGANVAVHGC